MQAARGLPLRNTPIITFVNKLDREVRAPLELLDEIEHVLKHRLRAGHLAGRHGQALSRRLPPAAATGCCASPPGEERTPRRDRADRRARRTRAWTRLFPGEVGAAARRRRADARRELARSTSTAFSRARRRRCSSAPAINNFGVQRDAAGARSTGRRRPSRATPTSAWCSPTSRRSPASCSRSRPTWTRRHRDRIAFLRVCSGRYEPGMKVRHAAHWAAT